jgi:hypothetical protein
MLFIGKSILYIGDFPARYVDTGRVNINSSTGHEDFTPSKVHPTGLETGWYSRKCSSSRYGLVYILNI